MNSHQFALFVPVLTLASKEKIISDVSLVHRIGRVLRLHVGDEFVLFDSSRHAQLRIVSLGKKEVVCEIVSQSPNKPLKPEISFLLPILKRDAFENAMYFLTQAGVNTIYPIITHKAQRSWRGQKERDRLERIIVAAAEQSKNFCFPLLHEPLGLEDAVLHKADSKIFFDVDGRPAIQLADHIASSQSIALLIGPEGDLALEEKSVVKQNGFESFCLTPTILRAQEAAGVAACMVRSLSSKK